MGFFNEDFFKELGKDIDVKEEDTSEKGYEDTYYPDDLELEVNKRNKQTFKELMDNASYKQDDWWDINDPIVRIVLLILFVIIVAGLLYYIIGWINLVS